MSSDEISPTCPASDQIALFLADVDGTLVDAEKKLTDKTREAVRALHDAGIMFTITSGRPPRGLAMLVNDLHITAPIAAFNGGLYISPDGIIDGAKTLPATVTRQTVQIMSDHGLKVWVYRGADWYVLDADRHGPHVDREEHTVQFPPVMVPGGLDELPGGLGDNIAKVVGVSDDPATIRHADEAVHAMLGTCVSAALSQPYYLDVTHPEANKGLVVAYLARTQNIPAEQIATIGDQPNDVTMFIPSGLSIAMGNANDFVKHAAHETVAANTAEGFAEAVNNIILPRAIRGESKELKQ